MLADLLSWAITALTVSTVGAFLAYLVAVARLPAGRRPRVPTYDRFGNLIGAYENPGAEIAPGRHGDPIDNRVPPDQRVNE